MCNCEQLNKMATDVKSVLKASDSNYFLGVIGALDAAINPNEEQIMSAKQRSNICMGCNYITHFGETEIKKKIEIFIEENFPSDEVKNLPVNYSSCMASGHLLFIKVFVKSENPNVSCPYKKWNFTAENSQKNEDISLLNPQKEQEPQTDSE